MKKILAIIVAAFLVFAAVACAEKAEEEDEKPENETTNTEQTITPESPDDEEPPESKPEDEKLPANDSTPQAITYETFKEIIEYSMWPYDIPANAEKNIVHCVSGYNGDVELTYFSFVTKENAADYFDEIKSYFPNQIVMSEEDGDYEICKIEDGEFYYMAVRIDNTIIYGNSRGGYDGLDTWFYGLGYVTKK